MIMSTDELVKERWRFLLGLKLAIKFDQITSTMSKYVSSIGLPNSQQLSQEFVETHAHYL
jgi:hypothetical protein